MYVYVYTYAHTQTHTNGAAEDAADCSSLGWDYIQGFSSIVLDCIQLDQTRLDYSNWFSSLGLDYTYICRCIYMYAYRWIDTYQYIYICKYIYM